MVSLTALCVSSGNDLIASPDLLDVVARRVNESAPELESPDGSLASTTSFLRLPHPRTGPLLSLHKKNSFCSTESFNIALPSLFLPYHRATAQAASPNGSEDAWGILEVQSVSPPNRRSWFFTEGEVISGEPCQSLCREADANYIGG